MWGTQCIQFGVDKPPSLAYLVVVQTCGKCKVVLTAESACPIKTGRSAGRFVSYCRSCSSIRRKEYYARTKEAHNAKSRAYQARHREELRIKRRAYRDLHKEEIKVKRREVYINRTAYRLQTDAGFKLLTRLRTRIYQALKGLFKSRATKEILGCSVLELRTHLEKQFRPGMTWKNYGPVWHVDHIRPCASFDLTDPAEQQKCFNFSNLQPLFKEENLKKGDKHVR